MIDHKTQQIYNINKRQIFSLELCHNTFLFGFVLGSILTGGEGKHVHLLSDRTGAIPYFLFLQRGCGNWSQADWVRKRLGFSTDFHCDWRGGNALGRENASPPCREELPFNSFVLCEERWLEQAISPANQSTGAAASCPFTLHDPFLVN